MGKMKQPLAEEMLVYTIPYHDKFIIYRPLKRLAFVANAAMVNYINSLQQNSDLDKIDRLGDAFRFLESVSFFEPDPLPPAAPSCTDKFKPAVAVLCLTTACNFRCIYCYASGGEKDSLTMPLGSAYAAIDLVSRNARERGLDTFRLDFHGGGEPTLAMSHLRDIIAYAKSKDQECILSVATNGYWTPKKRDWLLSQFNSVSLSMDGVEGVHNRQRPLAQGKNSFQTVLETVREMDRRKFPYGIRLTVTDESVDSLPEGIEFLCKESGCETFQVEPAFNHGRAKKDRIALTMNQTFSAAFLQAHDIAASLGRHLYYSGARPWAVTSRFCTATEEAVVITHEGLLTGCYEICDKAHPLSDHFLMGRIDDGKLLVDDFARKELICKLQMRRELCRDCFCYWHCAGDCPSKTLGPEKDSHLSFGERCDLNRLLTKELLIRYISLGNGVWQGDNIKGMVCTEVCA
jgi:uncharacterized protein